ncbi:MAG TPA: hypothetical protein VK995_01805, partial [Oceanipulchritudo sp.]|nr:hypothetical protein [Oceanipulchritudo sp.]
MAERIVSQEREDALIMLLDDPSPMVQEALAAEFKRIGREAIGILQRAVREGDKEAREQAAQLLKVLMDPDPSRMLVEFIRGLRYDLETGLFLINRVINPSLQILP